MTASSPRNESNIHDLRGKLKNAATFCLAQWDRFWFQPRDSYSLAVLRVLAGGMLLYSHLVWGMELEAFFGSTGWNNAGVVQAMQSGSYAWSFWWYVPDAWLMPVHVACCLILLMFFLGAFTRVTSVLSWLIAVSYAHRAMLANYGLDQILSVLVLYLTLAPCGQYLSLDAWRRRWSRGEPNRVRPSVMSNVACRLVQCHLCVMYLFAGLSKLQGRSWWNGEAVWETLANYEYQSTDLTFLAAVPFVTHLATHATVAWEVSFCALVWNRYLRPVVLLIGMSMHFGIGMFLGMWTFGLAMMFGYTTFVPDERLRVLIHGVCRIPAASVPANDIASEVTTAADVEVTKDPCDSLEPSVLILVCRSLTDREKTLRYFHNHGQRVLMVDGMAQARELCRCSEGTVVVLDPSIDDQGREYWMRQVTNVNPRTRFVFLFEGVDSPYAIGNARIIHRPSSLRAIRLAIESLAGPMIAAMPGASQNDDSDSADEYAKSLDTILAQQDPLLEATAGSKSTSIPNSPR